MTNGQIDRILARVTLIKDTYCLGLLITHLAVWVRILQFLVFSCLNVVWTKPT